MTVLALVCIIPAAYSFSRFDYRGRNGLLTAFLAINMVGAAVLIIPLYKLMFSLGLLNSYWSMIIPGAAFTVPTGIFLMRSYFLRIPKELEEAAYVDGAGRLYTLWRVILPVALPGIVVVDDHHLHHRLRAAVPLRADLQLRWTNTTRCRWACISSSAASGSCGTS